MARRNVVRPPLVFETDARIERLSMLLVWNFLPS